ncbi:MAG: molybdopterin molybdenumtransferase MoeA, partial [Actinobacteria bacterium]|nr:molybdopterin molybdenumtransferase MoeA [Actinomycetota bacterium]NIU69942.1 molybdopterin molybdenumtransferase MoeA [Actinomycetota bacterium]NIW31815.1 molybdopterin molybdenumtransferase MoeA [Actinomycetota bacterium]NIX23625.1 molybdopterin molybdenumtransferase MoeA [Actinomycetota bacterium]
MADHHDLIPRADAVGLVLEARARALERQGTASVPLHELGGRVAAEAVVAESDRPPHSHATMDGYAVDADDPYPLEVVDGEVFPEDEQLTLEPGTAMPIATGAPVPAGATAV